MYERSPVNVKIERGSTYLSEVQLQRIHATARHNASYSFTRVKDYATVEIHSKCLTLSIIVNLRNRTREHRRLANLV